MRKLQSITAVLIILLGLLHIGVTFHDYDRLSIDAVWFAGSGIAIVLSGFLNVAMIRDGGKDTVIWAMGVLTNVLFLLGFAGAAFMLPQPQVYIGLLLFAITTACSFFRLPAADR